MIWAIMAINWASLRDEQCSKVNLKHFLLNNFFDIGNFEKSAPPVDKILNYNVFTKIYLLSPEANSSIET